MPNEGSVYKSIEEVRSILYPRGATMLDLEKEDVLEFPANLTDESLQAAEKVCKRSGSAGNKNPQSNKPEKIQGGLCRTQPLAYVAQVSQGSGVFHECPLLS
jgi:hypothetical protein